MRGRAADLPGAAAGATQLREKEEPGWALRFSLCKVLRLLSGQPGWGWREGQELLRSGLAGWRGCPRLRGRGGEPVSWHLLGPGTGHVLRELAGPPKEPAACFVECSLRDSVFSDRSLALESFGSAQQPRMGQRRGWQSV